MKERGREEQGVSVRSAPPGRAGLWFSAERELQSCGTSSWANTTGLSCTSCSPFAQNGSGRPVPKSMLTWNCSTQQAEQVSERSEEKNCSHVIKVYTNLFAFPSSLLPVSGGVWTNVSLQPYTRWHRSPSLAVSSVGAGQNVEVRNDVHSGIHPIWDWFFSHWLLSSKWEKRDCIGVSVNPHEHTSACAPHLCFLKRGYLIVCIFKKWWK